MRVDVGVIRVKEKNELQKKEKQLKKEGLLCNSSVTVCPSSKRREKKRF
jgi:hypothetical protein